MNRDSGARGTGRHFQEREAGSGMIAGARQNDGLLLT